MAASIRSWKRTVAVAEHDGEFIPTGENQVAGAIGIEVRDHGGSTARSHRNGGHGLQPAIRVAEENLRRWDYHVEVPVCILGEVRDSHGGRATEIVRWC